MVTLVVLAKACVPGRVKTRLHPPFSLVDAARIAAASLEDTLAALAQLDVAERILCFDGDVQHVPAAAHNYTVVPQVAGGLDERIASIVDAVDGPVVLVGMDTPQVNAASLAPLTQPWPKDTHAWFGPATDGGFWLLALGDIANRGGLVRGVPMSESTTGAVQLQRLLDAGLGVEVLEELTDIDDAAALAEVVAAIPGSRTACVVDEVTRELQGATHE